MNNNEYVNPVGNIKKDIYIIKNDINDKVYIGQALNSYSRFLSHCKPSAAKNDNSLIDKAIQKYGKEHFWFEILEHQIENYNEKEREYISLYNSKKPNGYNILDGGDQPPVMYGDEHPNVKISDEDVVKLKEDLKNTTLSLQQLAEKYNISKKQVLRINQGISRSALDEEYPIRKNPNSSNKLSNEDIDLILEALKYTYRFNGDIAKQFKVDVHLISDINQGKAYAKENISYPIRNWKSSGVTPLTYEDVTNIIDLLKNNTISMNQISKNYNVACNVIININNGKSKKYKRENIEYPIRK